MADLVLGLKHLKCKHLRIMWQGLKHESTFKAIETRFFEVKISDNICSYVDQKTTKCGPFNIEGSGI